MFGFWNKKKKNIDFSTLKKQANKGDVNAQYEMSLVYYRGEWAKKDLEKASYWLEKAKESSRTRSLKS